MEIAILIGAPFLVYLGYRLLEVWRIRRNAAWYSGWDAKKDANVSNH